jgi:hypothetical protein
MRTLSGDQTREILGKLPQSLQKLAMHAIDDCDTFPYFPDLTTLTLSWPWGYATENLIRLNERCPALTSLRLCFDAPPKSLESFRGFKGLDKLAIECREPIDLCFLQEVQMQVLDLTYCRKITNLDKTSHIPRVIK